MHRRSPILCLSLALFLVPQHGSADQEDARLDALFERLRAAESPGAVETTTRSIWRIWRSHESASVSEAMARGMKAMAAGRLRAAEGHFDRVVDMAPAFAEGWNQRATARYLQGRFTASAADVRRVLVLEPRHFGALEGLGMIYLKLDRPRAALEAFRDALEVNPHLPGAREKVEMLRPEGGGSAS